MIWKLDKERPICPQIREQVCARIASGEFKGDEKLLSVREVAMQAGVNPNTVQKAFEQLESIGMIYSVRGSGWYVSSDTKRAVQMTEIMIRAKVHDFAEEMQSLGVSREDLVRYLSETGNTAAGNTETEEEKHE